MPQKKKKIFESIKEILKKLQGCYYFFIFVNHLVEILTFYYWCSFTFSIAYVFFLFEYIISLFSILLLSSLFFVVIRYLMLLIIPGNVRLDRVVMLGGENILVLTSS